MLRPDSLATTAFYGAPVGTVLRMTQQLQGLRKGAAVAVTNKPDTLPTASKDAGSDPQQDIHVTT